jgi:hypothetical protein
MVMLLLFYDVLDQFAGLKMAQLIWKDIGECFIQKALNIINVLMSCAFRDAPGLLQMLAILVDKFFHLHPPFLFFRKNRMDYYAEFGKEKNRCRLLK